MTKIQEAKTWLKDADAVIVTAGNRMAINEGLDIFSENFMQEFPDWAEKTEANNIANALDVPSSWQEKWQLWSDLIDRYTVNYQASEQMKQLKSLLADKPYFIASSSFAHLFEKAGFDPKKIFNIFGDWTKTQCSSGINHGHTDDLAVVEQFKGGSGQVPVCKTCGKELELHMPMTPHFYPDTDANHDFRWFITNNEDAKLVVLQLGVDLSSPQLAAPVIELVGQFPNWRFISCDLPNGSLPYAMQDRVYTESSDPKTLLAKLM
ncbi:hypothetical protein FC52_GL001396 [Lactobacillus pasteurii DSM 23907 = CRBIP 24.76]|uniref:Deacetylase sirtuin-type domain-containing protein n=1 Tax=Lactobacillus pasteurii DSM 23907 = CRBIP 24.76 TaxID=1423790 RepID=I7JWZ8_9LACO|nr:hypothetical protein [Lactobacillus pasteurii]KRK07957.1 hypothetical protein FC52_GL001396 [Lactobacillus pasteurii DSM 23907 = CRBIP 24.76]TDG77878.1 hypothetical protein C5L33_001683 [Lactobacillus pasteurii]CCI84275.1 Putative uncharacterized protein [Lactobacillus pasteurii DSM 23907 = CRBIP 24.76]